MPGKCMFNDLWLLDKETSKWLCRVEDDKYKADCKVCRSKFDVSHSGISALKLHEKGRKHQQLVSALLSGVQKTLTFTTKTGADHKSVIDQDGPSNSQSGPVLLNPLAESRSVEKSDVRRFTIKDDVLKAETLWALHCVLSHTSNRSGGNASDIFKIMFTDSFIASKFQMHKDKLAYMVTYGLGPFFQEQLVNTINKCDYYCISLDESLNKVSQKGQMDIIVRFWDTSKSEVSTRYLTSAFLGHAKASDLLDAFSGCMSELGLSLLKLIQIETDGPNVNLKFLTDFQEHMEQHTDSRVLDIGTCSLHIVHGCYKTAHNKTEWKVNEFLRALYYLFKDFPSRRADYQHFSGSSLFPLKLCSIRWVENSRVIDRAITILPFVQKYVQGVKNSPPASKNYFVVSKFLADELLLARLYFLQSIASELESFLIAFQTDKPLLPFLYIDLSMLFKNIAVRCLKKEVCSVKNLRDLLFIDLHDLKNQLPLKNIDVGFGAKGVCSGLSDVKKCEFQKDCKVFLLSLLEKLKVKSPLCKRLVKGVTCFTPEIMLSETLGASRLSLALDEFICKKQLSPIVADHIKSTYKNICNDPAVKTKLRFYSRKTNRLDCFLMEIFSSLEVCDPLVVFAKKVLVMFHGNAAVERGFSINKQCIVENLEEESLIAQRCVCSAVSFLGGITNVAITKAMLMAVSSASSKRQDALKQKKFLQDSQESKVKQVASELKELKKRKLALLQQTEEEAKDIQKQIDNTEKRLREC